MDDGWAKPVLAFWFEELAPASWFEKSDTVDREIANRFLSIYEQLRGVTNVTALVEPPDTALASVIVLDQFPRNMFRGSARMFESDSKALELARAAVERGIDLEVPAQRRLFLYLPFEHSEDLADQDRSVALFTALGDQRYLEFAEAHRSIVRRFGRFPHRNALLARETTAEEAAFLAGPGSSF